VMFDNAMPSLFNVEEVMFELLVIVDKVIVELLIFESFIVESFILEFIS